jgi:hypothetical protein
MYGDRSNLLACQAIDPVHLPQKSSTEWYNIDEPGKLRYRAIYKSWPLSLSPAKQMVRIGAISSIVALYWTRYMGVEVILNLKFIKSAVVKLLV